MTPFAAALARWAEAFANGAARLDPLTRARLRSLSGRSIEIELDPPGDTIWLRIDGESIRLDAEPSMAPSVRVRGSPAEMAALLFDAGESKSKLQIEGDDAVLGELRSIVRNFRPDGFPPLDDVVGQRGAQAITSLFEIGASAFATFGRSLRDEGERLARDGVKQRYLTKPDFDRYLELQQQLRVRIDRLTVRTDLVEAARNDRE
jgi:ubiquinone biosynthesis protein UbiJ